jgi:hypothetical protein
MIRPMHFRTPTDEEIHMAFEQREAAIRALFHDVAVQMAALARQLAKQGEVLHELQARLAQTSRNSSTPPHERRLWQSEADRQLTPVGPEASWRPAGP